MSDRLHSHGQHAIGDVHRHVTAIGIVPPLLSFFEDEPENLNRRVVGQPEVELALNSISFGIDAGVRDRKRTRQQLVGRAGVGSGRIDVGRIPAHRE